MSLHFFHDINGIVHCINKTKEIIAVSLTFTHQLKVANWLNLMIQFYL